MTEAKTTCQACGAVILAATAQATGGYCRNPSCDRTRRVTKRRARRTAPGPIEPCPYCGNYVRSFRLEQHLAQKCEKRPRPHQYAEIFPRRPIPKWLKSLADANSLPPSIPLNDVLRGSCFYPSSGLDSSPVLLANGCVHSFVYVDYSINRNDFLRALDYPGFSPYDRILSRDVQRHEIVPPGWASLRPLRFDNPGGFDGRQRLMEAQQRCTPFGHWSIWKRRPNRDERVGPRLFSFLFLGGEAVAAYQGLYERNGIVPKVMALIQPGHVMGDNWTNFYNPHAPLWNTISAGEVRPDYLLIGCYDRRKPEKCPFDDYNFVLNTMTYDSTVRTIDIYSQM